MVGDSPIMNEVYRRIERIAPAPVPVLILGQAGTGKEVAARAIHEIWGRSRPFVALNCAALPETLVESELFGYERGAFTGAVRRHVGVFARADGGILFLDEIAELPLSTQAKLLRVLETGEYYPVGGERAQRSRFRLLAATNQDLEERVRRDQFRMDLRHRLGVAQVVLPLLSDRLEDLPALANTFLARYREKCGGAGPARISQGALDLCAASEWPGNVRQFRNVVEISAAIAATGSVLAEHVAEFVQSECQTRLLHADPIPTLSEAVQRAEREAIGRAIQRAAGDRVRAAELLGISPATLYRRLRLHHDRLPTFPE
jgi:DNA-binding NtrC family response regulator